MNVARFLLVMALLLAAGEVLTRRSPASFRWSVLASTWLVLVFVLFYMVLE